MKLYSEIGDSSKESTNLHMLRGPLGNNKYKPKFSGHDTFPFRYAWLTKFVRYVEDGNLKKIKEFEQNKLTTIADFGIGLNILLLLHILKIYLLIMK